jgi:hypothetical protein
VRRAADLRGVVDDDLATNGVCLCGGTRELEVGGVVLEGQGETGMMR